jgi:hypothetical protein
MSFGEARKEVFMGHEFIQEKMPPIPVGSMPPAPAEEPPVPSEVMRPVYEVAFEYYDAWSRRKYGVPMEKIEPNLDTPSGSNYAWMKMDEAKRRVGESEKVRKWDNTSERSKLISRAVEEEMLVGVLQKYDQPELSRTAPPRAN